MIDLNERLARNVTQFFIKTLVDEIGKYVVAKCGRRPGPVTSTVSTDDTEVRFSIHLDNKERQEKQETQEAE